MVWYFHLFQDFPQFVVIHTVKGFGIVNKVEIDVFLELSCLVTSYLELRLQNFEQFVVIHTVKGFGIVNKAEVDVFLELSCFFDDQKNC